MITENFIDEVLKNGTGVAYAVININNSQLKKLDNSACLSDDKYAIIKIEVENAINVYVEQMESILHPENYKNAESVVFSKKLEPVVYTRKVKKTRHVHDSGLNFDIPYNVYQRTIKYTNSLKVIPSPYGDIKYTNIRTVRSDNKYYTLPEPIRLANDAVYKFATSDDFILITDGYPSKTYPIVTIGKKSQFFEKFDDASDYIKELEA